MKIMIADDELSNRLLMKDILTPLGQCSLMVNGQEALEMFQLAHSEGEPFDVIFLDIMMPVMDGVEALKGIRDFERENGIKGKDEVAIFMTTALSTPEVVIRAFNEGGCTDYLPKPVLRRDVLRKLQEYRLIEPDKS